VLALLVATGFGALIAVSPAVALLAGATWLAVAWIGRRSSLASLSACIAAPLIAAALQRPWPVFALALAGAALIVWRHEANIRRLLAGTEPRIGEKT